jgi:cytochrome c biogenesis protein CcmG/thiol:disulfide interchange protein DsbE
MPPDYQPPDTGEMLRLTLLDGTEREQLIPINPRRDAHKPQPDSKPQRERPAMKLLGKPAPQTTLNMYDGQPYAIGSTDQIVVLNFYASWCGFCRRQMPTVEQAYQEFKDNPRVKFIAVSQDQNTGKRALTPEQVAETFRERKLTHALALDPEQAVGKAFQATSYPTLFVLGRDGKVEAVHIGATGGLTEALTQEINTLLAGKSLAAEKEATATAAPKAPPTGPEAPGTKGG